MNKMHILAEISRTAVLNGGFALGKERFYRETGIKEADWSGKHWARWSDRRFEAKRKNGEWFELSSQDVKAFKRRKYM